MQDGKNQSSEPDPNKDQADGFKGTRTKGRRRKVILYGAVAALVMAGAGFLASIIHSPILAILLFFSGLIVAIFGLRLDLINNGSTHLKANLVWAGLVLPSSFLCGWLLLAQLQSTKPDPNPTAKFIFFVSSAGGHTMGHAVALTNNFLIRSNFDKIFDPLGYLIIPVVSPQEKFPLVFTVQNTSPSEAAQNMIVAITLSEKWSLVTDWVPVDNDAHSSKSTFSLRSLGWQPPNALLPGNGITCPPLFISTPSEPFENNFVVMARCSGSPTFAIHFRLHFVVLTPEIISIIGKKELKPFIVLGKRNSDGNAYIEVSKQETIESQK